MLWLAERALRWPRQWILGVLAVTAMLAGGLFGLELLTDGAALRPPDNEVVRQSKIDQRTFHDPDQVIVLVTSEPSGPAVESPAGFVFLKQLDEALRQLPSVRASGVRSLAGLMDFRLTSEEIGTSSFLDSIPEEAEAFAALVERIRRHPLADGLLLGRDGESAALYVPPVQSQDRRQLIEELERFLAQQQTAAFSLQVTGPQIAETLLGEMILSDLSRLIPIMVLVITGLLWSMLRTPGGVLIPFAEVGLVLLWTFGAMAWAGVPITLVTTLLPVLLMAMAITDEIHLLERFQGKLAARWDSAYRDNAAGRIVRDTLLESLKELEKPILATSLTTAIGLLAFVVTTVTPLRHFGLFAALGVLLAMALTFTAIPAMIAVLPARWFLPRGRKAGVATLRRHEAKAIQLGPRGLLIAGLLLVLATPGVLWLQVEDNWIENFSPESSIVAAEGRFNQSFWGTHRFDIVWQGPAGFFFRPEGVALVEEFTERALTATGVEGSTSYLVPIGQIARAADHQGALAELSAPRLADYVTLAMMSEDPFGFAHFVTPDGSSARARLFLEGEDYRRDLALAKTLDNLLVESEVKAHFSGDIPIGLEMVRTIVSNQLRSMALTFAAVAALITFLYGFSRSSLAVMLPVITATFFVFGCMGYAGLPLGIATSMFASLTLGVGVDFGSHLLHTFRHQSHRQPDVRRALTATWATAGKAIRWNAAVLTTGFLVLTFSALRPNHSLGLLLVAALASSYAMTLLLLPSLLGRSGSNVVSRASEPILASAEAGG